MSTDTLVIAVCIPTYNQAGFLPLSIGSALAQAGCETVVWVSDDASTDGTAAVLDSLAAEQRVRSHRHPQNQGIAANAGWVLRQPDTEFVVRLDSDDLLDPEYVASLAAALRANPSAGVAHAAVREIDQNGIFRRLRQLVRPAGFQSSEDALRAAAKGYRVAANICMFRRAALPSGMIYRPGMNFCEDWDLWVRIADAGWGNVYVDKPLASYRVWTDKAGYRAGRKLSEIEGYRRVFEESLAPAYARRGWSGELVRRARARLAGNHVGALRNIANNHPEFVRLEQALRSLGEDRIQFRLRLLLVRLRLGIFLDWAAWFETRVKDTFKSILRASHAKGR